MSRSENYKSGRNKAQTIRKLIQAVGEIVRSKGFSILKISTIAKKAQVDRKLIYRYFRILDYSNTVSDISTAVTIAAWLSFIVAPIITFYFGSKKQ
jgi:hypothetical protein